MFSEKEYCEVNREERHFGNLFISSLIYDDGYKNFFKDLINKKIKSHDYLQDSFDLYSETAILRDYWFDLGDYKNIAFDVLNINRRKIINIFLGHFGIGEKIINENQIFWSSKMKNSYLLFPGKWTENKNIKILQKIERINEIPNNNLCRIGWAFNAKPDLLIISNKNCILIELKIESGFGKNDFGYYQPQTQQDITELIKISIPYFKNMNFKKILISKEFQDENEYFDCNILWTDLLEDLNNFNNELIKKHFRNIPQKYKIV
jgi:hypothetical protein